MPLLSVYTHCFRYMYMLSGSTVVANLCTIIVRLIVPPAYYECMVIIHMWYASTTSFAEACKHKQATLQLQSDRTAYEGLRYQLHGRVTEVWHIKCKCVQNLRYIYISTVLGELQIC